MPLRRMVMVMALAGVACVPPPGPDQWFAPGCYRNPSIGLLAFEYLGPADSVGNAKRWISYGGANDCTAGPFSSSSPATLVRLPSTTSPADALARCRELMVSVGAVNIGSAGFGIPADAWVCTPDNSPPVVAVPGEIVRSTEDPDGIAVSFVVTAIDDGMPVPPAVTCAPPSGSRFPVGTTTVNCQATDLMGLTGTASFRVTVVLGPLWPTPGCYSGEFFGDIRPSGVTNRLDNAEQFGTSGGMCTGSPTRITLVRAESLTTATSTCSTLLSGSFFAAVNLSQWGYALPADAWLCF